MMDDYAANLLRACAAYLQLQAQMTAAQQMFQKGYFALSVPERIVVGFAASNFQALTPDHLGMTKTTGVGFLAGQQAQTESSPPRKAEGA
jgi:hypothetical protein